MGMPATLLALCLLGVSVSAQVVDPTVTQSQLDAAITALKAEMTTADTAMRAEDARLQNAITAGDTALDVKIKGVESTTTESMDSKWTLIAAFLVFFMQAGFGMLESGTVRKKNEYNILVKNVVDSACSGVTFWAIGYAFAMGGSDDPNDAGAFLGSTDFFLINNASPYVTTGFHSWVFQWAFAATAATIVSGSVAERTQFSAYLVYTCFITTLVYPPVVHWVWGGGWLAERNMIDFAGSGVVHMVGGVAGLVGAIALGPRIGRFTDDSRIFHVKMDQTEQFRPSSVSNCALGTFILWFGWYGFNCGSTVAFYGQSGKIASLAAINTTLSPASSVMTALILQFVKGFFTKRRKSVIDLCEILNCVLAGLVGITAGCATVRPWSAALIGMVSAVVYMGSSSLLKNLKIDDPIDAAPVHFFAGWWGVLAVGIFADSELCAIAGYTLSNNTGELFGVQLYGSLAIIAWTATMSAILFFAMKALGYLRASKEDELEGMDISRHGVGASSKVVDPSVA